MNAAVEERIAVDARSGERLWWVERVDVKDGWAG